MSNKFPYANIDDIHKIVLGKLWIRVLFSGALSFAIAGMVSRFGHSREIAQPVKIPQNAQTLHEFVPQHWTVLASVYGDLTGDGIADGALVIVRKDEPSNFAQPPVNPPPRCLVIAVCKSDKRLHKAVENWKVIMPAGAGEAGEGEAFRDLSIANRNVKIEHHGGSNIKWGYVHKFRLIAGRWKLVGETDERYNSAEAKGFIQERNFLTGYSNYSYWDGDKKGFAYKFYYVRTLDVKDLQHCATFARPVNLIWGHSVVKGRKVWGGKSDLSARLRAAYQDKKLLLVADVVDDKVTGHDTVVVLDRVGRAIPPLTSSRTLRAGGYTQRSTYALGAFGVPENPLDAGDTFVFGTVEIHDVDDSGKVHCILSTSDGGKRYPGEFQLTKKPDLPSLSNWENTFTVDPLAWERQPENR